MWLYAHFCAILSGIELVDQHVWGGMTFIRSLLILLAFASAASAEFAVVATARDGGKVVHLFEVEELEDLPQQTIETKNDFIDGKREFSGPLVREVLAKVGRSDAREVIFTAVNDYTVTIPAEDFASFPVILALRMDGQLFSRRDKGPIWLMYPIDDYKALQAPDTNNKLIWQLVKMEVR